MADVLSTPWKPAAHCEAISLLALRSLSRGPQTAGLLSDRATENVVWIELQVEDRSTAFTPSPTT